MESPEIYKMKLHDTIAVTPNSVDNIATSYFAVTRVPGGWIYQIWSELDQDYSQDIFVPFDNEFMSRK